MFNPSRCSDDFQQRAGHRLATSEKTPNVYASPYFRQWISDGVVYLEGNERFAGAFALYRNGEVFAGVASRDLKEGRAITPEEDIEFIPLKEANDALRKLSVAQLEGSQRPTEKLQALLRAKVNDESKYQELLAEAPWALGMQYRKIQRHTALDDENIPDFTAVRSYDGLRDIIEVKLPFMPVVKADGKHFRAEFNESLDQAERYLDFVHANHDYFLERELAAGSRPAEAGSTGR